MGGLLKILAFVITGIVLLWIGYLLFFGTLSPFYPYVFTKKKNSKKDNIKGKPGEPQTCLVCSTKLFKGGLVKTTAFPSASGAIDRLMYIRGCNICLNGGAPRICPICKAKLNLDDYLVSRMFERSKRRKNHVHVLGCNHCKKLKPLPK